MIDFTVKRQYITKIAPSLERTESVFTGIVEACVLVTATTRQSGLVRLGLDVGELSEGVQVGDSMAVDGACLTVVKLQSARLTFDVSDETCELSTLGQLRPGDRVNIERPLRIGDRLGGHFVQGHVDGTAQIMRRDQSAGQCAMSFRVPAQLSGQMILKGSIAVDGISLTISKIEGSTFEVAAIPHTLDHTTLGIKHVGDRVNIETDLIGKWVAKLVAQSGQTSGSMESLLEEHGFK